LHGQLARQLDQLAPHLDHFRAWHRQPKPRRSLVPSISFAKIRTCWGLFWNLTT
jgi:hypothetical protein